MNLALETKPSGWTCGRREPRGETSPQERLLRGYLHKTSNSLCGIKGYASLIADGDDPTRNAGHWARKIISEVERMEQIFRSVGDLTGSRQHPDLETDLGSAVTEVVRQAQRALPDLEIFTGSIPAGRLLLPAVDLAMILQEILKNSAEAPGIEESRCRVEIHGESLPTGRVALTVRDYGPGISPALISQVADPFLTTKPGHLGIGLARVETLVDMYGLAWALRSEPGQGTAITLETADLMDQGGDVD